MDYIPGRRGRAYLAVKVWRMATARLLVESGGDSGRGAIVAWSRAGQLARRRVDLVLSFLKLLASKVRSITLVFL